MTSYRVAHLNTEMTWRGGEGQTFALAQGLALRGHRSVVVARPGSEMLRRAGEAGLETAAVPMKGELNPAAILRLRRLFRELQPDVVHMHTSHAHTLGVLGSLAAGVGRRIVSRRVDFSIYRHALSLSGFKYRHGVDRYIAISEAVQRQLIEDGVNAQRISLVHSGVDPGRLLGGDAQLARSELGVPEGAPLVGTTAHFGWHKSLETLIAAAEAIVREVPEAWIAILGDGSLRSELEAERDKSPVRERILMPGFRHNVQDYLAAFDVFTMPSVMEGLCTAILDAFAVGVPVAASRAGGIPELVEHEKTGILTEPRQPRSLAAGIVRLLEDRELATRLTTAARDKLQRAFTHDAMVEGTLEVYAAVCGRQARAATTRA